MALVVPPRRRRAFRRRAPRRSRGSHPDERRASCLHPQGVLPYGSVEAVAVQGDYAYFRSDPYFAIANLSDPAHSTLVGAASPGAYIRDIAVSGTVAYLATSPRGLLVFDVTDPSTPREIGAYSWPNHEANAVALSDHYAFVATYGDGLRVLDVSTPAAPVEVGSTLVGYPLSDLVVSGDTAYVTWGDDENGDWELLIVDVSSPAAPVLRGSYFLAGQWPSRVAANGPLVAFATGEPHALHLLNAKNPAAPVELGAAPLSPGNAGDVKLTWNLAYVSGYYGLTIVDISWPYGPSQIGTFTTAVPAWSMALDDDQVVLADGQAGLRILDVSMPTAPVELGAYDTADRTEELVAVGSRVYLTTDRGLQVVDVSDPASPVVVGQFSTQPLRATGVAVSGNLAYVGTSNTFLNAGALQVVDLSTPSSPHGLGSLSLPSAVDDVAVVGSLAFVANHDRGLKVVDVSNPALPVLLGSLTTPGRAEGVALAGGVAYLANGYEGLRVIDVSTPASPVEIGSLALPGYALKVALQGNLAYVACHNAGLRVVDVSTPALPVEVGTFGPFWDVEGVALSGDRAYLTVSEPNTSLLALDLTVPTAPVQIAEQDLLGLVPAVAVADGRVSVSMTGLAMFDACGPLFADGFESGDTSAWSATVPGGG